MLSCLHELQKILFPVRFQGLKLRCLNRMVLTCFLSKPTHFWIQVTKTVHSSQKRRGTRKIATTQLWKDACQGDPLNMQCYNSLRAVLTASS